LRRAMGRSVMALSNRTGRGRFHAQYVADAAAGRLPFWGGAIAWQGDIKDGVLANGHVRPDTYAIVEQLWRDAERERPGADLLQKMTYLELKLRLAELLLMRVDKMTMATSVEARVPFLDHELVQFAISLPERHKVRDGTGKHLLKTAVDGLVDHDLVWRRKQGFGAPVSEWFRAELGEKAQHEIRTSALAERGLIDYDHVDELWAAHRAGQEWSFQLWNLYNVSAWYDQWVAGRELVA
jgi:asparagine synthase (glutamine-hydrolysing)